MTARLSEAERTAASNIAAMLTRVPPDAAAHGFGRALQAMAARMLGASWPIEAAADHALVFASEIVEQVRVQRCRTVH